MASKPEGRAHHRWVNMAGLDEAEAGGSEHQEREDDGDGQKSEKIPFPDTNNLFHPALTKEDELDAGLGKEDASADSEPLPKATQGGATAFIGVFQSSSDDSESDLSSDNERVTKIPGGHHMESDLAQRGTVGENYLVLTPASTNPVMVINLIVSSHLLRRGGRGRVVVLVKSRESALEQAKMLQDLIPQYKVSVCTQEEGRAEKAVHNELVDSDIVICTAAKLLDSLQEKRMAFDDISLLFIESFHKVHHDAQYTEVMHSYLVQKHRDSDLTIAQVVGLTSVTDAASCFKPEVENTTKQLLSLCAIMDATSGIKISSRVFLDPVNRPVFTLEITHRRDPIEPFVGRITMEMTDLERRVDLRCPFKKWSQEYNSLLQQRQEFLVSSSNLEERNQLTVLDLLHCYSKALSVYMDARFRDALSVLLAHSFTDPTSRYQEQLAQGLDAIRMELTKLAKRENPILKKLEEVVLQEFLENPELVMVLVAHTEQQASCFYDWLLKLPSADDLDFRPYLLTISEEFEDETEGELVAEGIKIFEDGKYNILVTTPNLAEVAHFKECSVIVRLQSISNELAAKLLRDSPLYKPPSRDSVGMTVLSNSTKKPYKELRCEESEAILRQAIRLLPTGRQLHEEILKKQKKIVRVLALKRQHSLTRGQKKKRPDSTEIKLEIKCRVCGTVAVSGADIYLVEEGTQCVVPDKDRFQGRITLKHHLPPKHMIGSLVEMQRIFCEKCGTEWGALCYWPLKGYEFHVLRCRSFSYEVDGSPHTLKRWSEAPFTIPPLSAHPNYPLSSSDSGTMTDEECSD